MTIDISTDFTLDTPHYWDGFWNAYDGLGVAGNDPDSASPSLRHCHQAVWSRRLPCGKTMELQCGKGLNYLLWNDFCFGSDCIITGFRYARYRYLLEQVAKIVPDYKAFVEDYLHRAYTIGGMIIFPRHSRSINQARGINTKICDRWDLTLECIRRYYQGHDSPLYATLSRDNGFFDLFVDFRGYVDYFFLQDCVTEDYSEVRFWIGNGDFNENPLPNTTEQYLLWIDKQIDFVNRRNNRIAAVF